MFQRVMYGKLANPANESLPDVSRRELWTLVPIVVFLVWIGVYPRPFLQASAASSRATVEKVLYYSVPQKVTHDHRQRIPVTTISERP
jgi:NADH-quinone oxidoreductase subunit M